MPASLKLHCSYSSNMRKFTLLLTLFLTVPVLGQTVSPPPRTQTANPRPQIRADFDRRVDDARVYIDGIDFTHYVETRGDTVYLNPPYNLDFGAHQVQVITEEGYQANWSFSVVGSGRQTRGTYDYPNNRYPDRHPYDYSRNRDPYDNDRYPYDRNRYPYDNDRYPYDDNDIDLGEILPNLLPYILRQY